MRTWSYGIVFGLSACAGGDPSDTSDDSDVGEIDVTITDQPLEGDIKGDAWSFVSGDASLYDDSPEELSFTLTATTEDECNVTYSEAPVRILFSAPNQVGEWALDINSQTITVYTDVDAMNYVASTGNLRIDEITDTTVTGGLHLYIEDVFDDSDNNVIELDGTFTANLCERGGF